MAAPERLPVLAIVNASDEITRMLAALFRLEGFRVVTALPADLRRGQPDPSAFLRQHEPAVVVWVISIPYEDHWAFFQSVQASEAGRACRFVVTTTNKRALDRLVDPTPAQEIVGKPYDLDALLDAVRRAVAPEP